MHSSSSEQNWHAQDARNSWRTCALKIFVAKLVFTEVQYTCIALGLEHTDHVLPPLCSPVGVLHMQARHGINMAGFLAAFS